MGTAIRGHFALLLHILISRKREAPAISALCQICFAGPLIYETTKSRLNRGVFSSVPVLEIHIDRKAVGSMKLRISIRGDVPTQRMAYNAILL